MFNFVDSMAVIAAATTGKIGRGGHKDISFDGGWAQCLGLRALGNWRLAGHGI